MVRGESVGVGGRWIFKVDCLEVVGGGWNFNAKDFLSLRGVSIHRIFEGFSGEVNVIQESGFVNLLARSRDENWKED